MEKRDRCLLLTNNSETVAPLRDWLEQREQVTTLAEPLTETLVKHIAPSITISYNYKTIVPENVLAALDFRVINLHISLLPWNRGADPNVWSFLENTPKGVTIHLMDKGLDTGDILLQTEMRFDESVETLRTSYQKLHSEIQDLLITDWLQIKNFQLRPRKQTGLGSKHFVREFAIIRPFLGSDYLDVPIDELRHRYKIYCNDK